MPTDPTPDHTPSAALRDRPGGNVTVSRAKAAGLIAAAPRPCSALPPTSTAAAGARPATSEPAAKQPNPQIRTRRRPNKSANLPPSSKKPPKASA